MNNDSAFQQDQLEQSHQWKEAPKVVHHEQSMENLPKQSVHLVERNSRASHITYHPKISEQPYRDPEYGENAMLTDVQIDKD